MSNHQHLLKGPPPEAKLGRGELREVWGQGQGGPMGVTADRCWPSGEDVDQLGPGDRTQCAFHLVLLRGSQN